MKNLFSKYNDFISDKSTFAGHIITKLSFMTSLITATTAGVAVLALPFITGFIAAGVVLPAGMIAAGIAGAAAFGLGMLPALGVSKLHEVTRPPGKDYAGFLGLFFNVTDFTVKSALAPLRIVDAFNQKAKKKQVQEQAPAAAPQAPAPKP